MRRQKQRPEHELLPEDLYSELLSLRRQLPKVWAEAVQIHEELGRAEAERNTWKQIATAFVDALELDGFGAVRDAHYGDLTAAMRRYQEATRA